MKNELFLSRLYFLKFLFVFIPQDCYIWNMNFSKTNNWWWKTMQP